MPIGNQSFTKIFYHINHPLPSCGKEIICKRKIRSLLQSQISCRKENCPTLMSG